MGTQAHTPGLVYWLPLDEAARRFAVPRDELVAAARRGELDVRAKVVGGDVVASVSTRDLTTRFGPPRTASLAPLERTAVPPAPSRADELDAAHGRLVEAQERARVLELDQARLAGRLEVADRVERGLQRYVDRLEERAAREREGYELRLAEAERQRLQLARLVGRLEGEVTRLQGQLDAREAPAALPAPPPVAPHARRRRWFLRR